MIQYSLLLGAYTKTNISLLFAMLISGFLLLCILASDLITKRNIIQIVVYLHVITDGKPSFSEENFYSGAQIRPATHVPLHGGAIPIQQPPQVSLAVSTLEAVLIGFALRIIFSLFRVSQTTYSASVALK